MLACPELPHVLYPLPFPQNLGWDCSLLTRDREAQEERGRVRGEPAHLQVPVTFPSGDMGLGRDGDHQSCTRLI